MLRINSVIINFEINTFFYCAEEPYTPTRNPTGTWQHWMFCMYPRSSYMTDFLPPSAPYNSLLHGIQ